VSLLVRVHRIGIAVAKGIQLALAQILGRARAPGGRAPFARFVVIILRGHPARPGRELRQDLYELIFEQVQAKLQKREQDTRVIR